MLGLKASVLGLMWLLASTGTAVVSAPGALARVQSSQPDGGELFGAAVALSRDGRLLVVGVDLAAGPDPGLPGEGAVHVYQRDGLGWKETARLTAPQPLAGAGFGFSVALSDDGQTLAVGAPFAAGEGTGAVHVFAFDQGHWRPEARLQAPAGATRFGEGLALSADGTRLVVAASLRPGHSEAHLYDREAGRWRSGQRVEHESAAATDDAAPRLALSGDGRGLALGSSASAVVNLFELDGQVWQQAGAWTLAPDGGAPQRLRSLAFSSDGRTLALAGSQGRIDVLENDPTLGWRVQVHLRAEAKPWALGDRLVLSADGHALAVTAAADAPHVYRFQRHGARWHALPALSFTEGAQAPFLAVLALSADGRTLAVGSRFEAAAPRWPWTPARSSGLGAVHLFAPA